MKKVLLLIAACLSVLLLFSACSEVDTADSVKYSDESVFKDRGIIRIGYDEFVPMTYHDGNGDFTGFDAELSEAVCNYLGYDVQHVTIDWPKKEEALTSGEIDFIWSGLTVADSRKSNVSFSVPYMNAGQIVVIDKQQKNKITSLSDLSSSKIAAIAGSTGESAIYENDVIGSCSIVTRKDAGSVFDSLVSGEVDAIVIDYVTAAYLIHNDSRYSSVMILDNSLITDEKYAVGLRSGSDMTEKINSALKSLSDDGIIYKLACKYGVEDCLV